jgi:hypothetical protein
MNKNLINLQIKTFENLFYCYRMHFFTEKNFNKENTVAIQKKIRYSTQLSVIF